VINTYKARRLKRWSQGRGALGEGAPLDQEEIDLLDPEGSSEDESEDESEDLLEFEEPEEPEVMPQTHAPHSAVVPVSLDAGPMSSEFGDWNGPEPPKVEAPAVHLLGPILAGARRLPEAPAPPEPEPMVPEEPEDPQDLEPTDPVAEDPPAPPSESSVSPIPALPHDDTKSDSGSSRLMLGARLVAKGYITDRQLSEALLQQPTSGKRLGALLIELGLLDERNLSVALAEDAGLEVADLRKIKPDSEALKLLPEGMARSWIAMPLTLNASGLRVAVSDPNPELKAELARTTGRTITMVVAPPTEIRRSIDSFYRALVGVEMEVKAFQATARSREAESPLQKAVSGDAPVVKVVTLILTQALRDRTSDIHIEPQEDRLRVRFRIDGALHDVISLPSTMAAAVVSRLKIMAGMNIVERQRSQDGQIAIEIDGRSVDIRVATTATIWGEKAVLRLLDKSKQLFRLADLGMSPEVEAAYSKLIQSPFGMVVCAGPTGCGKTTTLYATLNEVNSSERNVMTIEDPVEYIFPSINQIQIKEQAGVTFAGGLKAILRQDPDVILVGEIRDAETARIAVQSALTGHFVLSSIHATDAASALHRFLDMGIESFLISASVTGLVGQRLLRRICTECRVRYQPSPDELVFFRDGGEAGKEEFWYGEGCNFCSQTGYLERIGVYELLQVTGDIKQLIVDGAGPEAIRRAAVAQGMSTMRSQALQLVSQDITTIAEVMRTIYTL
jgi:type IV pilus assembly protein PilB